MCTEELHTTTYGALQVFKGNYAYQYNTLN